MDFRELTGLLSAAVTTRRRKIVDLAVPGWTAPLGGVGGLRVITDWT
jgi:hypothetical protein